MAIRYKIFDNNGDGDMHSHGLIWLQQAQVYGIFHNMLDELTEVPLVLKLYYGHILMVNEANTKDPVVQLAFMYDEENIPSKEDADAIVQQYMG